jgi:hypothetical protein
MSERPFRCQSQTKKIGPARSIRWRNRAGFIESSGLAPQRASVQNSAVHKDKPPGIFDLTERSMRYAAGFCFVVGFLVSVIVRIGVALAHEHFSQATPWSGF